MSLPPPLPKPLLLKGIGPGLIALGALSILQSLLVIALGMEVPGAAPELQEAVAIMAKVMLPMGFLNVGTGIAFRKNHPKARAMFLGFHLLCLLLLLLLALAASETVKPILLGQLPGMIAMLAACYWYLFWKPNVVRYFGSLRSGNS